MTINFPDGFLWGTATAAHQVEGGNWNNDWWAFEHDPGTAAGEVSGDACDHFWRYPDDIAMLADLGFGAYRFSLEWSRIEPEDGEWSASALDHYLRMVEKCRDHDLVPVVTFHHFTTPRWLANRGGWDNPEIIDHFARFSERVAAHLGDEIGIACTINEPNVVAMLGYLIPMFPPAVQDLAAYQRVADNFKEAHRKSFDAIKSGPGDYPVGATVAMGDWWAPEGAEEARDRVRQMHEGQFLEATRGDDFVGVQAYSRTRLDERGLPTGPEEGVEMLDMNYEYWPQSLEVAIRYANEVTDAPIYVTENGIGTTDDEQRIRFVGEALEGVDRCLQDGIDVHGYFYWSLLDNFEWAEGYKPRFGLVAVDLETQVRTIKPSASWLGEIARANRVD